MEQNLETDAETYTHKTRIESTGEIVREKNQLHNKSSISLYVDFIDFSHHRPAAFHHSKLYSYFQAIIRNSIKVRSHAPQQCKLRSSID